MGVDIGKQKRKQKELEEKNQRFSTLLFWSPKQGKNLIRLMPPWTEEGINANDFAREYSQHWLTLEDGSRRPFTCPARTPDVDDDVCEICDYKDTLRATGNPEDEEAATEFYGRSKYISNIVDLNDPVWTEKDIEDMNDDDLDVEVGDVKVQIYRYGPQVYKQLVDLFGMLEMDLTDFEEGCDLIVTKSGKGQYNTNYTVIQKGSSPFKVEGTVPKLEDVNLVNLDLLDQPRPHEEMRNALPNAETTALPKLPPTSATLPPAESVDSAEDLEAEMRRQMAEV